MLPNDLAYKLITLPNKESYAYRESGNSKKVIVFVHGMLDSSKYWEIILPHLSDSFRCIAIDLRGHGHSSYNSPIKDLEDFANDIKLFVDALSLEKISLVGWSMGGGVVMKFAAKYAEYVDKIILHSSVGIKGWCLPALDENGKFSNLKIKNRLDMDNHPVVISTEKPILEKNRFDVKKAEMDCLYHGLCKPEPERIDSYVEEILLCRCTKDLFWALNIFNISIDSNGVVNGSGEVNKIKCKVLILHGDNDQTVPLSNAEETANSLKELAIFKIFKGAGHAVLEDYRKDVIDLIKLFAK